MRKICYTARKRSILMLFIAVTAACAAIALFIVMLGLKPELLDSERLTGIPSGIPEERGYTPYSAEGVCEVSLCGNPEVEGKTVWLYLTNPDTNSVWLRAEIYSVAFTYDAAGNITSASPDKKLGTSGFLRPGEYVEAVTLSGKLREDKTYVMIKISTYVEETGLSNGFFYINTALFS